MGTWTTPNNASYKVIDGMSFNIGDLMGAGLDPFDNLSSSAVMAALARHNKAKNFFNQNPLFLGTNPEATYQQEDDLSNPLLVNPLTVDQADNTNGVSPLSTETQGIQVISNAADTGDYVGPKPIEDLSPEEIMEVYKDRKIDDLIRDFPSDDKGSKFPYEVVKAILIEAAKNNNKNAEQILTNSGFPVAGPDGVFGGDKPSSGDPTQDTGIGNAPQGNTGTPAGGTPAGGTPQGQTGTPQSGAPTGGAGTVDTGTGSTPTVSTGSVLDQSGTENVNVDDQPIGLPNIPISTPRQPEKKAGMIMQISQSAPIVETVFDDILFEPKFTNLDNIPEFGVVGGLLRTLA